MQTGIAKKELGLRKFSAVIGVREKKRAEGGEEKRSLRCYIYKKAADRRVGKNTRKIKSANPGDK